MKHRFNAGKKVNGQNYSEEPNKNGGVEVPYFKPFPEAEVYNR